jgi:hypothetical protein
MLSLQLPLEIQPFPVPPIKVTAFIQISSFKPYCENQKKGDDVMLGHVILGVSAPPKEENKYCLRLELIQL